MSGTLTPPIARIPIGLATVNGQQIEVRQHPEFVRFFFDLFNRVGGVNGFTPDDLLLVAGAPDPVAVEASELAREALQIAQTQPAQAQQLAMQPDVSSDVQSLRAELEALRQIVNGLQQGYQL